ncbi:MAG: hypothetical protein D6767_06130 [Candidatus Hydrogenedentota bacterium]|nr:MAG: hypothetical protein D6767_06130 [Candidatus Hydrogenedentota bacterium]
MSENFYESNQYILGGEPPTAPVLNPIDYPAGERILKFTPSVDPDSDPPNQIVNLYYLYHYYQSVPSDFQDSSYRIDSTSTPGEYNFQFCDDTGCQDKFIFSSGKHIFMMTAFDGDPKKGGRESAPSNFIDFTIQ